MTVIAGLITKPGWGYMAADIGVSDGDLYSLMAEPKVVNFYDEAVVGYAGNIAQGRAAFRFLWDTTGPSKLAKFERHWNKDTYSDCSFLFLEQGRLYEISEGSVIELKPSPTGATYGAIGTGAAVALGSLYADHIDMNSCLNAVKAAIAHVPGVYGPPVLTQVPPFK
jgi:hypothetical protein